MSTHKNDKEEFKKYLSGKLSPGEEHAFERKALSDPFQQEALEGLEAHEAGQVIGDLEKLEGKLTNKKSNQWLKVAASIILISVASVTTWLIMGPLKQDQEIVMEESKPLIQENSKSTLPTPEPSEEKSIQKFTPEPSKETNPTKKDISSQEVANIPEKATKIEEKVKDVEESSPAAITMENLESAGFADESGDDFFAEGESVDFLESEVSEEEIIEDLELKNSVTQSDPLEQTQGFGAPAPAKKAKSKVARRQTRSPRYSPPSPIDVALFNQYLTDSLRYPQEALTKKIEGLVILKVTVSSLGSIKDITVNQSLGYGCDQEAVRLIKEGPDWDPAMRNGTDIEGSSKVEVQFKLPKE